MSLLLYQGFGVLKLMSYHQIADVIPRASRLFTFTNIKYTFAISATKADFQEYIQYWGYYTNPKIFITKKYKPILNIQILFPYIEIIKAFHFYILLSLPMIS